MPPAVCEDIATKGLQQCEIPYGKALIENLAKELTARHGKGFDRSNFWNMRGFYLAFPKLGALRRVLAWRAACVDYCKNISVIDCFDSIWLGHKNIWNYEDTIYPPDLGGYAANSD